VKSFEHFLDMLIVYGHVIKIDHNTNIQNIRKYVIHKSLKVSQNELLTDCDTFNLDDLTVIQRFSIRR